MNRLLHELRRRLGLPPRLNLERAVLIYQMGKVASSSIYRSLRRVKSLNVVHVHRMNPVHITAVRQDHLARGAAPPDDALGLYLYEHLAKPRRSAKIISLVREPIGRNVSAYFQNLQAYAALPDARDPAAVEALITRFLSDYPHEVPLTWFDREPGSTLGLDVFAQPFPQEAGYQRITAEPYELLLLRHDLGDDRKAALIADFLDLPGFTLHRHNTAADKRYAAQYAAFLQALRVPAEYADRMLGSAYARHFYSQAERDRLWRKWTGT